MILLKKPTNKPKLQHQQPDSKHQRKHTLVLTMLSFMLIGGGLLLAGNFISEKVSAYKIAAQFSKSSYASQLKPEEVRNVSIQPTGIYIKNLKINAPIVPVGLTSEKSLQVPQNSNAVGWYIYGTPPGDIGPAVITGHLDSLLGPAVFYHLKNLRPGDNIEVSRSDGSRAIFRVDSLQEYSQNDFPTDKVYGKINYAGLRIITCSGTYDKKLGRYTNNLVVYATLINILPKTV